MGKPQSLARLTPYVPMPGQEKLVAAITKHATRIMGEEMKTVGVPIYTDARPLRDGRVPTVLYGAAPHSHCRYTLAN